MPDLKIAVATNGPVPDNQCALKDAILFAAQSDQEFSQEQVVQAAEAFYAFLVNPQANAIGQANLSADPNIAQAQALAAVQPPVDSTTVVGDQSGVDPTAQSVVVDPQTQIPLTTQP